MKRVFVTGMGAVTPIGIGIDESSWTNNSITIWIRTACFNNIMNTIIISI